MAIGVAKVKVPFVFTLRLSPLFVLQYEEPLPSRPVTWPPISLPFPDEQTTCTVRDGCRSCAAPTANDTDLGWVLKAARRPRNRIPRRHL